jgi:hypothetical protein
MANEADRDDTASSARELSTQSANWYKGTLDQSFTEADDKIAELNLVPGRATGVPVSKAWYGKKVYHVAAGQKGVHNFKSTCVKIDGTATLPPSSECDSGMLVKRTAVSESGATVGELFYSDNDTMSDNINGGSHVDAPFEAALGATTYTYEVVVFSRNRQSSHVNIWRAVDMAGWSTQFDGGGGTDSNGWNRYVGGTVVRLGPLTAGDYVEVRTRHDGQGSDKTWMWVFPGQPISTAEAASTVKLSGSWLFANYAGPREFDPKITIPTNDYYFAQAGSYNYAILSKEDWGEPLETFVDLVRGPLSHADGTSGEAGYFQGTAALNGGVTCTSGRCETKPFAPKRGRYQVSAWALPADGKVVGSDVFPTPKAAEVDGTCAHDIAGVKGTGSGGRWEVGAPNSRAFRMHVQTNVGSGGWVDIAKRDVPMATLGDQDAWSAIIMDLESDGVSSYRVVITDNVGGNSVSPVVNYRRNVDSSTLKVATFNHYFRVTGNPDKNMAWLLGRRPDYDNALDRIIEDPNRAPYEQEADVIAFQEVGDGPTILGATSVLNQGIKQFDATMGQLELTGNWYYTDGALWVNDLAKGRYASSAIPTSYLTSVGCESTTNVCGGSGAACSRSCTLGNFFDDGQNKARNALPVRGAARRLESDETSLGAAEYGPRDKKVMFVNMHFHLRPDERLDNVKTLATKLGNLVGTGAGETYFSAHGPLDDDLRIVLMGDSNGDHQQCAEMNRWLRELRAKFGYAVFVPMAALDQQNRTIDNYFGGAALHEPQAGLMTQLCSLTSWALPDDVRGGMCPKHYQGRSSDNDDSASNPHWYHWWTPNNDVIVLVGRGWRFDDPVQGFKMLNEHGGGHNTDDQPGGISSRNLDESTSYCAANDGTAYWPHFNTFGTGTNPCSNNSTEPRIGSETHRSDHPPVMAKFRIN